KFFLDCPHEGIISCVVKEVVPNEKLVYGFQSKTPTADTLVTITLAQEGKATRVTLVHSGWDALPAAEQDQADNYGGGWGSVMLWAVSRAPLARLQAYKPRMGWRFPWASSLGSDFNYDFNVSYTEEQQRSGTVEYSYRKSGVSSRSNEIAASEAAPEAAVDGPRAEIAGSVGTDWATYIRETPGMSAFAYDNGVVYHT